MKKQLALLIAAAMTLTLAACGASGSTGSASSAAPDHTITLGVFEPKTGASGIREELGIAYAQSLRPTVTVDGVPCTVVLDWQDSPSDPDDAVAAARQLVSDGCAAVIGGCDAAACIAAGSTFAQARLPAIATSCTGANVTLGNDYYFRTRTLDALQGTALADWATAQNYREIATVNCIDDESTARQVAAFTARFEENGGKVVDAETFQSGETVFTDLLAGLKASGVKAVFAPTSVACASLLLDQAGGLGWKVQWIAGDAWNDPAFLSEAGKAAEGVVLACAYVQGADAPFDQGVQAWLQADPARLEANGNSTAATGSQALAFDSYNTALDAIEAANSLEGPAIRDALTTLDKRDAVTGALSFDANGDACRDTTYLARIQKGVFTLAE